MNLENEIKKTENLYNQGEYEKAYACINKAYDYSKRTLGRHHVLSKKCYELWIHMKQILKDREEVNKALEQGHQLLLKGNFQQSVKAFQKCYTSMCQIYNYQHPEFIKILDWLVINYIQLEDWQKALKYNQECYQISVKYYGQCHPHTIQNLKKRAKIYREINEYEKALDCSFESLDLDQQNNAHPTTLLNDFKAIIFDLYALNRREESMIYLKRYYRLEREYRKSQ